jgi:hypothetical protein
MSLDIFRLMWMIYILPEKQAWLLGCGNDIADDDFLLHATISPIRVP